MEIRIVWRDEKLMAEKSKALATILINGPEIKDSLGNHERRNVYDSYCDRQNNGSSNISIS